MDIPMTDPVTPVIQEGQLSSPPALLSQNEKSPTKIFILIIVGIFCLLFFLPVPYYQTEELICRPGQTCPIPGWHLNPSIFQSTIASRSTTSYSAKLQPTPSLTPISDPTLNWKTYTNTRYQYSVRYPNDWIANSIGPGTGTMPLDDVQQGLLLTPPTSTPARGMGIPIEDIHIQIEVDSRQTSGETYEEWVNATKKNLADTTISITESEIASFKTTVIKTGFKIIYLLSSPDKTKFIFIETQGPTFEYRDIIDQILSTFKFLEPIISGTKGTVAGKVCYPSEGIPPGIIRAKNISTQEITSKNHPQDTGTFSMELSAGTYVMRFEPGGTDAYPGYHTGCSGVEQYCNDTEIRSSIQISVIPGNIIQDVKLCDFYYPASSQPDF